MIDGDTAAILGRIAVALERIAAHVDPSGPPRERKPAILSKATYSPEERETKEWKSQAAKKSQERAAAQAGTHS